MKERALTPQNDVTRTEFPGVADRLRMLLGGDPVVLAGWTGRSPGTAAALCGIVIGVGCGLFGFSIGWWRSPVQAVYSLIKLPLIIFLTTLGNGLVNGMVAPLLGLNLRFREALIAVLLSFGIASAILGAFSPLVLFMIWNTPPLEAAGEGRWAAYSVFRIALFAIIAFAGVAANLRLLKLLAALGGSATVARRILAAWLVGNLFLGSQIAWMLRPFIGSPVLPVTFVRQEAFKGNIFEAILQSFEILLK